MPIFEYECTQCGERTEHLQLSASAPLSKCPECGGTVRKLMSAPAFQFKGSGWYVTDYAGKGKKPEGTSGNGDSEKTVSSTESTKPSKSADSKSASPAGSSSSKESSAKTASPSD